VVLNTPYFTKGSEGQYQIRNVPPGDYKLNFFDERATRDPLSPTVISVGQEETQVTGPVIHISEAGYLQLPHKNKYGLDYPPGADAQGYGGPPQ